jgi:hypothetical protein
MPWVYFSRRYEFKPRPNVVLVYYPGVTYLVSQQCAVNAIGIEAAIPVQRPVRDKDAPGKTNGFGPPETQR